MKTFEAAGEAQLFIYEGQQQMAEAIVIAARRLASAIVASMSRYADTLRLS